MMVAAEKAEKAVEVDFAQEPVMFLGLRVEQEWADPRLSHQTRDIVLDAATFAFNHSGWLLRLTSIWRSK